MSTYVLQSMVEALLLPEDRVEVRSIFPSQNLDPASDVPSDQMIAELQKARLIILNGARFERGLTSIDLPRARTIRTAHQLRTLWMTYPEGFSHTSHQHGPQGAHQHLGVDGHTWMSLPLLTSQLESLISAMQAHGLKIKLDAGQHLHQELDQLWSRWQGLVPHLSKRLLFSNHPAYQYLIRDLKLKMLVVDLDPQGTPSETALKRLNEALSSSSRSETDLNLPPLMWWESSPSPTMLASLKPLGFEHVVIGTLEHPPRGKQGLMQAFSDHLHTLERAIGSRSPRLNDDNKDE